MTPLLPFWADHSATLYQGESYAILRQLEAGSFDAVVTDPPYSSGGLNLGARTRTTGAKYTLKTTARRFPDFQGDNRDQRSFLAWATLWLSESLRLTRPGGYLLCFSDWRQLPVMTDAIQAGGWIWRGIVPWDKTEGCRPQQGWFRSQCEYVITASHGTMGKEQDRLVKACFPGIYRENVRSSTKLHATGKPTSLLQQLLKVLPPESNILDPFAGSGTTLEAARSLGHRATGIEITPEYAAISRDRLLKPALPVHKPSGLALQIDLPAA